MVEIAWVCWLCYDISTLIMIKHAHLIILIRMNNINKKKVEKQRFQKFESHLLTKSEVILQGNLGPRP